MSIDYTLLIDTIIDDIHFQLDVYIKYSTFEIIVYFEKKIEGTIVDVLRKIINIDNAHFCNEFPILCEYIVEIYICEHFIRIIAK